jgi:flagellar basal body-associated protein FliL
VSDDQMPGEATQDAGKKKKKKDKVRSAWISFVGRIIAQAVGAAATVVLGLTVLHTYAAPNNSQAAGAPQAASAPQPAGDIFVAILPIDNFSTDPAGAGKRVRITVQLIESDDQPVTEVLALQADIASAIAKAVSVAPPRGQQRLSR